MSFREVSYRRGDCLAGHPALKADRRALVRAATHTGEQDDGEGGTFELWTCDYCASTFGVGKRKRAQGAK